MFLFILEDKNYIIHLPEFVDHFQEWDKNKDMVITIDEVYLSIASRVNLHGYMAISAISILASVLLISEISKAHALQLGAC